MRSKDSYAVLRWTARIIGVIIVAFTLIMFFGSVVEGYYKTGKISLEDFDAVQLATFFFWFIGLAGMVWAWWKEGAGGILSFAGIVIFLILAKVNAMTNSEASFTPVLFIFLIPSALFLLYWWVTRKSVQ